MGKRLAFGHCGNRGSFDIFTAPIERDPNRGGGAFGVRLGKVELFLGTPFAELYAAFSPGWAGFSQIGVTDLPLTATFSAAMLLALPWIAAGGTRPLPLTAGLLGLAVLAKGLAPLVLALPLLLRVRGRSQPKRLPRAGAG